MTEHPYYTVEYELRLEDGRVISYALEIDSQTIISKLHPMEAPPEWTRLETGQCNPCEATGAEYCPIALRLVEPMERFRGLVSHTRCNTIVRTPERSYMKEGDVQDALRSLFGLIMATSGCPQMRPFKHMGRYHLPFSTLEETISRITSTYLMREMLRNPNAKQLDFDLKELESLYDTMGALNSNIITRLRKVAEKDGALNAMVIFSTLSSLIPITFREELQKLKALLDA